MTSPAIAIDAVSKRFALFHERPSSVKERLLRMRRSRAEDFWALRDVSHQLLPGGSLGLVGANGSGKTTLLKVIAGILRPTSGTVTTRGRVAALLELGAGFHPELTGRENVYLNASILGLTKKETDRHFDGIVDFSELEEFIDNQVKFYSSGMYVRLGFAVAVHVDPDILLIDEVLSVGDEGFQRKCIARVNEFKEEGRTIVLVTHAVDKVRDVCDQALMLERGRVVAAGDVNPVLKQFRLSMLTTHAGYGGPAEASHDVEITGVELLDAGGRPTPDVEPGESLAVQVELRVNREPGQDAVAVLTVHDGSGRMVFRHDSGATPLDVREGAKQRVTFELGSIPFVEGRYLVTVGVRAADRSQIFDWHDRQYHFEIRERDGDSGRVYIPTQVRVEPL